MRYWWVNQNQTFGHETKGGFLWSPKTKKNGARNPFYDSMTQIDAGDRVFSFCDTRIKAIGIPTGKAETAAKPNFGNVGADWSAEGWYVPVAFGLLPNPIRPKDHVSELRPLLPPKYSPLNNAGDGSQSVYLVEIPAALADKIIELIGSDFDKVVQQLESAVDPSGFNDDLAEEAIKGRTDIGPTTKQQLTSARRGQGIFKANVRLNENRCRVTGTSDLSHLRASHIKPWSESSDEEKLNGCNGLLLAPHADHLFDKGFLSFAGDGVILVSKKLSPQLLTAWGIDVTRNVGSFNSAQKTFLAYHRAHRFKNRSASSEPD